MPELLEKSQVDRLDLKHRNPLQVAVMRKMLGANAMDGE